MIYKLPGRRWEGSWREPSREADPSKYEDVELLACAGSMHGCRLLTSPILNYAFKIHDFVGGPCTRAAGQTSVGGYMKGAHASRRLVSQYRVPYRPLAEPPPLAPAPVSQLAAAITGGRTGGVLACWRAVSSPSGAPTGTLQPTSPAGGSVGV